MADTRFKNDDAGSTPGFVINGKPRSNAVDQDEFQKRVQEVFLELRRILSKSFGAFGAPTFISNLAGTTVTKDGFTIMKNLIFDTKEGSPVDHIIYNMASDICARLNYKVGDGTTTAIIAATSIYDAFMNDETIKSLLENGSILPRDVIQAMKRNQEKIIKEIEKRAVPINEENTLEKIEQVVRISSNNDETITKLITDAYKEIGAPYINCVPSKDGLTKLNIIEGYRANAVLMDKIYVNSDEGKAIEKNVDVVIFNHKVTSDTYEQIIKPLNSICSQCGRKLLVMAPYYDKITLETTIRRDLMKEFDVRKSVNLILTVVRANSDAEVKALSDLAMLLNTTIIDQGLELEISDQILKENKQIYKLFDITNRHIEGINIPVILDGDDENNLTLVKDDGKTEYRTVVEENAVRVGFIDHLEAGFGNTFFDGFHYNEGLYEACLNDAKDDYETLTEKYANLGHFSFDVVRAQKRYNALRLKLAEIEVGGDSDLSQKMMKDAFDDSIMAAESAYNHGYILGCNVTTMQIIFDLIEEIASSVTEENPATIDQILDSVILKIFMTGFMSVYGEVLNNGWKNGAIVIPNDLMLIKDRERVCNYIITSLNDSLSPIDHDTGIDKDTLDSILDSVMPISFENYLRIYDETPEIEREEKMQGAPIMLNSLIPIYCVETSQVFDLTTRKFSDKIINSADTDIQVLIASIDLISLLISGNQLVITSKSNFQQ